MHNRDRMLGIVSRIAFGKKARSSGFALPAVLLSGVILMAMLVISSSAASSVVSVTKTQYYNQLAREAAESGIAFAGNCVMNDSENKARWSSALTTGAACTGANSCTGANCYVAYFDGGKTRSSFSVTADKDSQDRPTRFVSRGKVELYRSSTNTVWKSFDVVVRAAPVRDQASVIDFSSGVGFSCVVSNARSYCYGVNTQGQIGLGNNTSPITKPTPVKSTTMNGPIASIATGRAHACAVMSTQADGRGDVYCWGRNANGQLGLGNTTAVNEPVRVNNANLNGQSIAVVAGNGHTCALAGTLGNARAYCWGLNDRGQIGDGTSTSQYTSPRLVSFTDTPGFTGFSSLSAGATAEHLCGVAVNNGSSPRVLCWGDNSYGQVGNNSTTAYFTRPQLVGSPLNANIKSVVVGGDVSSTGQIRGMSCAVRLDNSNGYCWGADYSGRLGISIVSGNDHIVQAVRVPTQIEHRGDASGYTQGSIEKIAIGYSFACALRKPFSVGTSVYTQNSAMCWGANISAQMALDDGAAIGDVQGTAVSSSLQCTNNPSRGTYYPCVRIPRNIFATRIGEPGELYSDGVTDVVAGAARACMVSGGVFYCWGRNDSGQAGISNTTPEYVRWPTRADLIENLRGYRFF